MKRQYIPPHRHGFGMMETMFSMALLAMALAGAYAALSQAFYMARSAADHYQASSVALNRIERIRNLPPSDIPLSEESRLRVDGHGNEDRNGHLRRTTTVTDTNSDTLKQVTVMVEILNPKTNQFDERNESVTTLITNFPLRESN